MKNIKYSLIAFLLSSCMEGPTGDDTYTTIINKSGHSIEMRQMVTATVSGLDSVYMRSSFIDNNQSIELNLTASGEPGGPTGPLIRPLINADSIWIIYFEKASIWHTTDVNSPVSKSLMLESSYEGGKVKDGLYEFTYTFTPADFEEALEFGD